MGGGQLREPVVQPALQVVGLTGVDQEGEIGQAACRWEARRRMGRGQGDWSLPLGVASHPGTA
jgi:hypothetical protein